MDLKSGYPFWAISNGLMHPFPPLQRDLHSDVVVVGGGITITSIKPSARGVILRSSDGVCLHAGHVVIAAGYTSQQWLHQSVARNRSSYAFVTDPLDRVALHALADTMLWESARPYLYMRPTSDNRMLVGGEDDAVDIPALRDARVDRKAHKLAAKVAKAIPSLQLTPAFAWAAASPKPTMVCRSSDRIPNTGRACTSPWPMAAMPSPTACSARN